MTVVITFRFSHTMLSFVIIGFVASDPSVSSINNSTSILSLCERNHSCSVDITKDELELDE